MRLDLQVASPAGEAKAGSAEAEVRPEEASARATEKGELAAIGDAAVLSLCCRVPPPKLRQRVFSFLDSLLSEHDCVDRLLNFFINIQKRRKSGGIYACARMRGKFERRRREQNILRRVSCFKE